MGGQITTSGQPFYVVILHIPTDPLFKLPDPQANVYLGPSDTEPKYDNAHFPVAPASRQITVGASGDAQRQAARLNE